MKAVLFDAGNVLIEADANRAIAKVAQLCSRPSEAVQEFLYNSGLLMTFEAGQISEQAIYEAFCKFADHEVSIDALRMAACDMFAPIDGMHDTVSRLIARGVRLAIVSNTNAWHWQFIKQNYPIVQLFKTQILSYEVGRCKPHPDIYHAALDAVACDPHECMFFDDLSENVHAAKRIGINAHQFISHADVVEKLHIAGVLT